MSGTTPSRDILSLEALAEYAADFLSRHPDGAAVGLRGPLGAGKTTLVRAIVKHVAERGKRRVPRVVSPSFVIHQSYSLGTTVDHFDLYRLDAISADGLIELGYFDALARRREGGFLFVEWMERASTSDLSLDCIIELAPLAGGRGRRLTEYALASGGASRDSLPTS